MPQNQSVKLNVLKITVGNKLEKYKINSTVMMKSALLEFEIFDIQRWHTQFIFTF